MTGCFVLARRLASASFAGLVLALTSFSVAHATELSSWSFEANPHPIDDDRIYEKLWEIRPLKYAPVEGKSYCERFITLHYDNYNRHYPDFADKGDAAVRLKAWKLHAIAMDDRDMEYCIIRRVREKLQEHSKEIWQSDIYFCGQYSKKPETEIETIFWNLTEELISYSKIGDDDISSHLLSIQNFRSYPFNSDLEYFLLQSSQDGSVAMLFLSDPRPLIGRVSPKRRAFVDQAVAAKDVAAVLETTAPCAPRGADLEYDPELDTLSRIPV